MGEFRLWRALALVAVLLVAGCAGNRTNDLLAARSIEAPQDAIAGEHRIFVATTRQKAERPLEVFDGRRAPATSFAAVDVTVPAIHKTGEIERRRQGQPADPARYFVARTVTGYPDSDVFGTALRKEIARNGGRVLIFIHGYNTAFDSAVYRMTQIVHDARYPGTPILFSWASGGRVVDYVYDSNSASAARDALEGTMRMAARAGARRIDIIAHSMGNWVTMEALRQLAIAGDRDLGNRLGDVVLASPDIDVDVFRTQMTRYGVPDKPFFLFLSRDDRALRLSGFIAGNRPRLGDYGDPREIAKLGVIAVDISDVKSPDRLNHTKFAENPLMITVLGDRLRAGDDLETNERTITDRVNTLATNLGTTVTSAAEVVITTPIDVINIAVGGGR